VNAGTPQIRLINAQLRYYYKIDPAALTDNQWAMMFQDLVYLREQERKLGFGEQLKNLFKSK
jgi:hypothetical protein